MGIGTDSSIKLLAETIQKMVGHEDTIFWDSTKPDGTPQKLMDVSKMEKEGWQANISLEDYIKDTYTWFLDQQEVVRKIT